MIQGSRQTTIHACPDSPSSFFALRGHALWLFVISIHAKSHETVTESGQPLICYLMRGCYVGRPFQKEKLASLADEII